VVALELCKEDECKQLLPTFTDGAGNFGPVNVEVQSFFMSNSNTLVNCLPENNCRIVARDPGTGASAGAPITFETANPSGATIVTQATTDSPFGMEIQDVATVVGPVGAPEPTGTVTFLVYGPDDPGCENSPRAGSSVVLSGSPGTATSDAYLPTAAGAHRWVATYSGDENYASVTSLCNSLDETSNVSRATLTFVTQATPTAGLGDPISDTASTLVHPGMPLPTGAVTFEVYGPDDMFCSGNPVFNSGPRPLVVGFPFTTANSGPFVPTATGTYRWTASYSGDDNYLPTTAACNFPQESSVVTAPTATVTTQATPTANLGNPISDTATVTALQGLPTPTGTVVFKAYGGDFLCLGQPSFTSEPQPLSGSPVATANSGPFTPGAAGTYYWVAIYSGDENYAPVTTGCGGPNEESIVVAPESDVSIDKNCPSSFAAGATYSCILNIVRTGSTATNVVVTDDLDERVEIVQGPSGAGFDCTAQAADPEITCTQASMTDPFGFITYSVRVPANTPPGTVVSNTSTISSTEDSFFGNNTETVTTQVTAPPAPVCTITGTGRNETLIGTPGPDVICGRGGDDKLEGRGGDDVLIGGRGDDKLEGGPGDDILMGEAGDDRLIGDKGRDSLFGGSGDDTLRGGVGRDRADGGPGSDSCSAETRVSC
jgi:hypothetical protein